MATRILILHNIRSAENVGAMFRTADAIGMTEIIISGFTPTPLDRFGRPHTKVTKSSLGAEESVSWRQVPDIEQEIKTLKSQGVYIVTLEQDAASVDYKTLTISERDCAIIVGSETTGVEALLLNQADAIVEIPMKGVKESLNVATACGVVLFRFFDR